MRISRLVSTLLLCIVMAGCSPTPPEPSPTPMQTAETSTLQPRSRDVAGMADEITARINEIREREGLAPLKPDPELETLARNYSRRMATEGFLGHEDPAGDSAIQRTQEAGIRYQHLGENIFRVRNATSLKKATEVAVNGWMDSPGHRRNILREFQETGVGAWQAGDDIYVTQVFITPRL